MELGDGFAFVGEKVRVQVGNQDFELDLLFYHRNLQYLVTFKLKIGRFAPEHMGKLAFYPEALDRDGKRPDENLSIGVLLCRTNIEAKVTNRCVLVNGDLHHSVFPHDFHRFFAYYSPMGGERASTTRMRESGRICCSCKVPLDSPLASSRERYCPRCDPAYKTVRVRMAFELSDNCWRCSFHDGTRKLRRCLTFALPEKVTELARRGGGLKCLADVQALELGLRSGRGNVTLFLTLEQYDQLVH